MLNFVVFSEDCELKEKHKSYIKISYNFISTNSPDFVIFDNFDGANKIFKTNTNARIICPLPVYEKSWFRTNQFLNNCLKKVRINVVKNEYDFNNTDWICEYFKNVLFPNDECNFEYVMASREKNIIVGNVSSNKNIIRSSERAGQKNIIILGNDVEINTINFNLFDHYAKEKGYITAGVNRIFLKYAPDYLYFIDPKIYHEFRQYNKILQNKIITSDIFIDRIKQQGFDVEIEARKWMEDNRVISYPEDIIGFRLRYSITKLMQIFNEKIFPTYNCSYYIVGCGLNVDEQIKHFWNGIEGIGNGLTTDWYKPRFELQLNEFKKLLDIGYSMYNIHPNSRLNMMMFNTAQTVNQFLGY